MADLSPTAVPILNPDTPLAFLEPEAAYQTAVSIYVTAASLGVRRSPRKADVESKFIHDAPILSCRFWYGTFSTVYRKSIRSSSEIALL
jgi:hypothetical protein